MNEQDKFKHRLHKCLYLQFGDQTGTDKSKLIDTLFDKAIQHGRNNPETCEMEVNDIGTYVCNKCGHGNRNVLFYHCPYCGRKIKT